MYQELISRYLQTSCPSMWQQMTPTEVDQLSDQIAMQIAELEATPPWPAPASSNHTAQVAFRQQVRSWASETTLDEMLYQAYPPEPEPLDPEEQEMERQHQLTQDLLADLRTEASEAFDRE